LSIGTEIMLGEIVDTNAAYIAARLPAFGIDLLFVSQVGDNPARLREVIERAWGRSDLIIATGGLGPTEDDITRELVAETLGEPLAVDAEQQRILKDWFEDRGRPYVERNTKQAMLIASARALPNPRGTAPGWWVERDGKVIVLMPGPPAEMTHMWETQIEPELERRADSVLVSRTLKTLGVGEGSVDERLSPILNGANPSIGIYARRDGVHARISAKARTREEALRLIDPVEAEARRLLGPVVWGIDGDTLAEGVGNMLRERRLTLALMESATGGAIADALTDNPHTSDYFRGSLVTYATETKVLMGVPAEVIETYGVISRETAEAMARAVRERLSADIGLGLTGIAGGEPMEDQPPGTMHIAVTDGVRVEYTRSAVFQGRDAAKRRAVTEALGLLRKFVLEQS
jgi:nicotinamide-nucleotide amidase